MPQIQEIKVLNIDDVEYNVEDMSDEVKSLVVVYNEWNQDAAEAHKTFAQLQAAVRGLSQQIIEQVRADIAPKTDAEVEGTDPVA